MLKIYLKQIIRIKRKCFLHLSLQGSHQFLVFSILLSLLPSCKKQTYVTTAFYYWKSTFHLEALQAKTLSKVAENKLYLRFFDIAWNEQTKKTYPNAVIHFRQSINNLNITPVIYLTNKALDSTNMSGIDSLAINCNKLIELIASSQKIRYKSVQFDCDWTVGTKEKYFNFLRKFRTISHDSLEATIRLHQVKYKNLTGIPPVDKGILMFYNMGKPNTSISPGNSIYNENDAAKYVDYIQSYPLNLDVALPLFSWALQIRDSHIIQVYEKIKKKQLNNNKFFIKNGDNYTAKKGFFLNGIYIKENDIFKLEETDINSLQKAAKQLAKNLSQQNDRTVIYYELANLDPAEFNDEQLRKVSTDF